MKRITPAVTAHRKPGLFVRLRQCLHRLHKNEDGTATIEFVLAIPVIMTIFMASMESGVLMTRYIMLEKSVDMVMRELRLGQYLAPTPELLKAEICKRTIIMPDCEADITIELSPVNTTAWDFPVIPTGCIDRGTNLKPPLIFNAGAAHQIMLVRVCIPQNAMFPTSGIGLGLPKDGKGGYGLVATAAFVNEPSYTP